MGYIFFLPKNKRKVISYFSGFCAPFYVPVSVCDLNRWTAMASQRMCWTWHLAFLLWHGPLVSNLGCRLLSCSGSDTGCQHLQPAASCTHGVWPYWTRHEWVLWSLEPGVYLKKELDLVNWREGSVKNTRGSSGGPRFSSLYPHQVLTTDILVPS